MDYSENYKADYTTRSKERYLQRRRQVRVQRMLIAVAIIVTIVILSLVFGTIFAYAGSKDNAPHREKCYKSITIQGGDTLTSIAGEYISAEYSNQEQYINEVMHINYLQEDEHIQAGNCIIIPYYTQVL